MADGVKNISNVIVRSILDLLVCDKLVIDSYRF